MGQQPGAHGAAFISTSSRLHGLSLLCCIGFVPVPSWEQGKPKVPSSALAPQSLQPKISSYLVSGKFISPPNPSFPNPSLSNGVSLLPAWRASAAGKQPTCQSHFAGSAATGLAGSQESRSVTGGSRKILGDAGEELTTPCSSETLQAKLTV